MRYIHKKPTPPELVTYSKTPNSSYEDLYNNHRDLWEITRLSLADEQGYICCYCGQRITGFQGTQIEHIFPKGTIAYKKMQLDYDNNLIASCDGGKSQRKVNPSIPSCDLHCDTKKSDNPIPVSPLNPGCDEKFLYDENGDVIGIGSDAEATIEILNLSSPILKNMRKAAIDAYSLLPNINWKKEYERLKDKNAKGQYIEFCFVLRSYIELFHAETIQ